jgi:hypothetical protein
MPTQTISAFVALLLTLAILVAAPARADQKEDVGPYEIHYNVIPTGFLTPEVARRYEIPRSKAIGLVSISVLEKQENGGTKPVSALVEGRLINDIRQDRPLSFRRVEEGEAVYYLSQFQFSEGERLEYRANIRPRGHDRSYPIRFTQGLFND